MDSRKVLAVLIALAFAGVLCAGGPVKSLKYGRIGPGFAPMSRGSVIQVPVVPELDAWNSTTGCLSFDGIDDQVGISQTGLPSGTSPLTAMAWVKNEDVAQSSVRTILGWGSSDISRACVMAFWTSPYGFSAIFSGTNIFTDTLATASWAHYAITVPSGGLVGSVSI